MKLFIRHLPKIVTIVMASALVAGILMKEFEMAFSYAIVICLSCMGLG